MLRSRPSERLSGQGLAQLLTCTASCEAIEETEQAENIMAANAKRRQTQGGGQRQWHSMRLPVVLKTRAWNECTMSCAYVPGSKLTFAMMMQPASHVVELLRAYVKVLG